MRTETLAIVFTDIKGYTAATSAQTHQENAKMLKRIERIIAPVVRAYSGRVVKSIGDAYMIVFRSPTEAVRCATAVQDRLHQHNTSSSSDQAIHIRIAMNLGEVRVHRGDVFGEPVNIAARIESVTPADEIYLSHAIYLTMNRSDLPCERVGEYELKGIPEAVTVYRVKKFAHDEAAAAGPDGTGQHAAGLPFGGTQLTHWRRMTWVRRAYAAMWACALAGLAGATYLRYRPQEDYTAVVKRVQAAIEERKPTEAIALAGQIPEMAAQERSSVRRYRREAVAMLMAAGDLVAAGAEVSALLAEDPRDAEALVQRAMILGRGKTEADAKAAIEALQTALRANPGLAERPEVADAVVHGYVDGGARRVADLLVEQYVKQHAQPALLRALNDAAFDRNAKNAVAQRLAKLGASQEVDWVALAIEDLRSTSCKTKQSAIARLVTEGDERAVGPLMKLAETKACGASQAKKAAETILGK